MFDVYGDNDWSTEWSTLFAAASVPMLNIGRTSAALTVAEDFTIKSGALLNVGDGGGTLTIDAAATLTNNGTIRHGETGGFTIDGTIINNGNIRNSSGAVTINGTVENSAPAVITIAGGTVTAASTAEITNAGTINITGQGVFVNESENVNSTGIIVAANATSITPTKDLASGILKIASGHPGNTSGYIDVYGASTWSTLANGALENDDRINIRPGAELTVGTQSLALAGTNYLKVDGKLTNGGTITLAGSNTVVVEVSETGSVDNNATLTIGTGVTLNNSGHIKNTYAVTNNGTVNSPYPGQLYTEGLIDGTGTANAIVELGGAALTDGSNWHVHGSSYALTDGLPVYGGGTWTWTNEVAAGKKLYVVENQTLTIPDGKTLTVNGTLQTVGTVVNNGTLDITTTGKVRVDKNTTIAGGLTNNNILTNNGTLIVTDNTVTLGSTSTFTNNTTGDVKVTGGTLEAVANATITNDGKIEFDGGAFTNKSTEVTSNGYLITKNDASINLTSGSQAPKKAIIYVKSHSSSEYGVTTASLFDVYGAGNTWNSTWSGLFAAAPTPILNVQPSPGALTIADITVPAGALLAVSTGGTLTLTGTLTNNGTVKNYGATTISATGKVENSAAATISINNGAVTAESTAKITNAGTITVNGTAGFVNHSPDVTSTGIIVAANSGSITGTQNLKAGLIYITAIDNIDIHGAYTWTTEAQAKVGANTKIYVLDEASSALTVGGTSLTLGASNKLIVAPNGTLTVTGTLTNGGSIENEGTVTNNGTIANSGTFYDCSTLYTGNEPTSNARQGCYAVTATASGTEDFTASYGYSSAPTAVTVTLTNSGIRAINTADINISNATDYTLVGPTTATVAPQGTAAFTVQPKTGLKVSTTNYLDTILITPTAALATTERVPLKFEVLPKDVTIGNATIRANKVYDGTDTICIIGATINGIEAGDVNDVNIAPSSLFATLTSGDRASAVGVSSTAIALEGVEAYNYNLSQQPTISDKVDIAARPLKVINVPQPTKVYSGSAYVNLDISSAELDNLVATDVANVTIKQQVYPVSTPNKNVGKYSGAATILIEGTAAGNYSVEPLVWNNTTGVDDFIAITKKGLTLVGATVTPSKVYDGTDTISVNISGATFNGVVGSDDVRTTGTDNYATLATADAGTGIAVTGLTIALDGTDKDNYDFTVPSSFGTVAITPKPLSVLNATTASSKVYDNTDTITIIHDGVSTGIALDGIVATDAVTIDAGSLYATLSSKNASATIARTATAQLALAGAKAGNYTLAQPALSSVTINKKTLEVLGATVAATKVYDGTDTMTIGGSPALDGVVLKASGDPEDVTLSGFYATLNGGKAAGVGKAATAHLALAGADASVNYQLTQPTLTDVTVTPRELTVTGATAKAKVYDGTDTTSIVGATLHNAVVGDDVALVGLVATLDAATVGNTRTVTSTALVLDGADKNNYTLTPPSLAATAITAKPLTIANTAVTLTKTYDGSDSASVTNAGDKVGVITADAGDVTVTATAKYVNGSEAGSGKIISVAYAIAGSKAGNYLAPVANPQFSTSGKISKQLVSIVGVAVDSKEYDGNNDATALINISNATIDGQIAADNLSIVVDNATATFNNAEVGTGKTVTFHGFALGGLDKDNYELTSQPDRIETGVITGNSVSAQVRKVAFSPARIDSLSKGDTAVYVFGITTKRSVTVLITTVDPRATVLYNGRIATNNAFEVEVNGGLQSVTYTVVPTTGSNFAESYTFYVEGRLEWGSYVSYKWNNYFLMNNTLLSVNGFTTDFVRWYEEKSTGPVLLGANDAVEVGGTTGRTFYFELVLPMGGSIYSTTYTPTVATGIAGNSASTLQVYPNPVASGQPFVISIDEIASGEQVQVYSISGVLVQSRPVGNGVITLNVPSGVYIVRIGNRAGKVVVY
jgi:hypothetical protein